MGIKAGFTSHNRTVYAAPTVAGLVFRSLGHSATLHSHAHSRHMWAAPKRARIRPLSRIPLSTQGPSFFKRLAYTQNRCRSR
jgi:hypothetical protein